MNFYLVRTKTAKFEIGETLDEHWCVLVFAVNGGQWWAVVSTAESSSVSVRFCLPTPLRETWRRCFHVQLCCSAVLAGGKVAAHNTITACFGWSCTHMTRTKFFRDHLLPTLGLQFWSSGCCACRTGQIQVLWHLLWLQERQRCFFCCAIKTN